MPKQRAAVEEGDAWQRLKIVYTCGIYTLCDNNACHNGHLAKVC